MIENDERVSAYHEASHAVMAYILGGKLGTVSIVPSRSYLGVAFGHAAREIRPSDPDALGKPLPLLPARLRRQIECEVLIALAGKMGENHARVPETGRVTTDPDEFAAMAIVEGLELTRREHQQLLAAAERSVQPDDEKAFELSYAMAGSQVAPAYLMWLRAATAETVSTHRFRTLVESLVPVLLDRKILSGRAVSAILKHADTVKANFVAKKDSEHTRDDQQTEQPNGRV